MIALGGLALAAPAGAELGNAVRNRDVKDGAADRLGNQPDVAAMGPHQLAGNGKAEAGAAGAGR
jgi:hypothetical protein